MMQTDPTYANFLDFIRRHNQGERAINNRRMFSVFLWCFFVPAALSVLTIILVNNSILPRSMRGYLDWIVLIFPVLYSLYFLSSQVLSGLPVAFRQGGFAMTLSQAKKESEWRTKLLDSLESELKFGKKQWAWITDNLEEDLVRIQTKTRYITALAGAVFFLLMQGIDSITSDTWDVVADPTVVGTSSEWIGLSLFLVLLYLSGQQSYHHLRRYLACARWMRDHRSS